MPLTTAMTYWSTKLTLNCTLNSLTHTSRMAHSSVPQMDSGNNVCNMLSCKSLYIWQQCMDVNKSLTYCYVDILQGIAYSSVCVFETIDLTHRRELILNHVRTHSSCCSWFLWLSCNSVQLNFHEMLTTNLNWFDFSMKIKPSDW